MNSTTPGTLISYRFSPDSCRISSCPTISPLSPHAHLMLTYPLSPRLLILTGSLPRRPTFLQQQIVKKTISFFHLTHCYPSAVYCLSAAPLLRVGMGGGEVAKLRQMFISPLPLGRATLPRMDGLRFTTGPMWPSKRDPQPSSAATWISPAWAWSTWQPVVGFGKQLALLCTSGY